VYVFLSALMLQRRLGCAFHSSRNVPLNDIMNCIIYATHCANAPTRAATATTAEGRGADEPQLLLPLFLVPSSLASRRDKLCVCASDNKTADILPYDVTTAATTNSCNLQLAPRHCPVGTLRLFSASDIVAGVSQRTDAVRIIAKSAGALKNG